MYLPVLRIAACLGRDFSMYFDPSHGANLHESPRGLR
jgi:hypothetical protein